MSECRSETLKVVSCLFVFLFLCVCLLVWLGLLVICQARRCHSAHQSDSVKTLVSTDFWSVCVSVVNFTSFSHILCVSVCMDSSNFLRFVAFACLRTLFSFQFFPTRQSFYLPCFPRTCRARICYFSFIFISRLFLKLWRNDIVF